MYVARYRAGDVVQVDPGTGQVIATIAKVPCATGLAIDPVSGDLFVSENGAARRSIACPNPASGPGTVTAYATPRASMAGVRLSGTLYAESDGASQDRRDPELGRRARRPASRGSPKPRDRFRGAGGGPADVPGGQPQQRGRHARRLRARGSPTQSRTSSPAAAAVISRRSTRYGCLYITQSTSIVRIGGSGQACADAADDPGPGTASRRRRQRHGAGPSGAGAGARRVSGSPRCGCASASAAGSACARRACT